jgi:hypothetical protein
MWRATSVLTDPGVHRRNVPAYHPSKGWLGQHLPADVPRSHPHRPNCQRMKMPLG